eukprot:TRINITY_DN12747_c0_g3_i7.p1 TRINITY_DN12747_c0_g3~~TRINITY_DN12747_c0_g3_i7.p1  ORF type:complete len:186 (-),score=15.45 TRINITY_DN12747_c0_g3_i7:144-701(-)
MVERFPNRTENDLKNKFYSTLKKVANLAQLENPEKYDSGFIKCKRNLIQFIDLAKRHGFSLPSRRGRKKKAERKIARENPLLFPLPCLQPRLKPSQENPEQPSLVHIPNIPQSLISPQAQTPELTFFPRNIPLTNLFHYYPMGGMRWSYGGNVGWNRQGSGGRIYGALNNASPFGCLGMHRHNAN